MFRPLLWAIVRSQRYIYIRGKYITCHKIYQSKIQRDLFFFQYSITITLQGKAVPLQAWTVPEVSRKLRFLDFVTTAQDGGKVVSPTHRPPLPLGNTPGTHFC